VWPIQCGYIANINDKHGCPISRAPSLTASIFFSSHIPFHQEVESGAARGKIVVSGSEP
jgi:hypothetical protein